MRTITTVTWLFDALPHLLADLRVQVLFTLNGQPSAYEPGVAEAVREMGGSLLPWDQAVATRFDLAISASHYGGLEQLPSPLLILPHGPGYNKHVSFPGASQAASSALEERVAGTTVVLTHEQQRAQWEPVLRRGIGAVVVGDPCMDGLRASLPGRERYREALGVAPGQKLVSISSTWGASSLLAVRPELPSQLLALLPTDEYAVAMILHPNIWVGHGPWQVRVWLRRAVDAGLRLIPVREGWRGTIVAADLHVGDHGSVTLYAAALGAPVLLAAFGSEELLASSPLASLGRRAPHMAAQDPDLRQIDRAASGGLDPERYADLAAGAFAHRDRAIEKLRAVVYDLIGLDEPAGVPPTPPVPLPEPEIRPVTAHLTTAQLVDGSNGPRVTLKRYPAVLEPAHLDAAPALHLAVEHAEHDHRLRESAAVIARGIQSPSVAREPLDWFAATLAAYPGCRLVVCAVNEPRSFALALRDGPVLELFADREVASSAVGSAVYAVAVDRGPDARPLRELTVVVGDGEVRLRSRPYTGASAISSSTAPTRSARGLLSDE